jgi:hypothetical protein
MAEGQLAVTAGSRALGVGRPFAFAACPSRPGTSATLARSITAATTRSPAWHFGHRSTSTACVLRRSAGQLASAVLGVFYQLMSTILL